MRRSLVLAGVVFAFVVILAAPAMAQARDPFEPAIDTSGANVTTTGEAPTTVGEGEVPLPAQSETLATTGTDTEPWFAIAYALIAVGGGAVVLSRMMAPTQSNAVKTR